MMSSENYILHNMEYLILVLNITIMESTGQLPNPGLPFWVWRLKKICFF